MKTRLKSFARRAQTLCLLLILGAINLLGVARVQAGLALEMNVIRYDQFGYYFSPNLTTNSTPPNISFGEYELDSPQSPTNGISPFQYHFDTNGFNQTGGFSWGYSDFTSVMHQLTNGLWSIFVTNSVTTNVYRFKVTAHLSSNDLPLVAITFPTNGAVNITNQPTYTWNGPTNYSQLVFYYFNNSPFLPLTQTSLVSSLLYQGLNSVTAHYDSNSTTAVVSSVPTNNASQTISSWVSTARLQDYATSQFTVGAVDPSGTSHILVAHYAWDGTNANGSASGVDSSGNGYNLNYGGSFGSQGGTNSSTDPAAGPRAIQFHNGDGNSAGYVGWNPTPANLLSALAGSFSVSCWIKTTQNNFGWDQAPAFYGAGIVSADNGGLANDVVPLALTGSKIGFNTGGDVEDVTLNSTASVNDGNYHHIVVTRNQLTGQKIIYIDGVLDSFSSGTTNLLNDPQKLTIGALADASDPDPTDFNYNNGYDGLLDDLQIYSGVLSSNDVANLYSNPGSTIVNGGASLNGGHSIVARYNFEQTNAPGVDSSGLGNDSNCGGGDGNTNFVDTFSATAAVGSYSRNFQGHTFICFGSPGASFSNLARALSGSFSVSAWIKTTQSFNNDSDNADSGASIVFAEAASTNSTVPLALTGSKVAVSVNNHNGINTTLHSQTSVNDGQYHQIAMTRNQADGTLKVYVDGAFEGSASGPTDLLYINSIISLGGYFNDYNGLLDDVQIYSGVLADAEVASLFANRGSTVPDKAGPPVAHYDFDEGTVLAFDVTGNANNVVHAGDFGGSGPAVSSDTVAGAGAVSFDGSSYLTASSNLLSTLAGEFSVSLWLKTSQDFGFPDTLAWQGACIISADIPNGGAKDLIPVALTGGQVAFNIGDGFSDSTLNSGGTVNDDTWHHIVVTRSMSTGLRQIFIDGALDNSDFASTAVLNTPVLLTLGAKADSSNPDPASPDSTGSNGYEGLVDDVQIYNQVLSSNDVAFLYQNPGVTLGSATNEPYPVDVNLQFGFSRSQDNNLGEIFGASVSFNSVSPAPTTTNSVHSPHDYFKTLQYPGGGSGSGAILNSLGEVLNEFTNGLWKIYINQNSPTQQVYSFQVSISGLDTNLLKAVRIFSPTNGALNVATNPVFYWVGPSNYTTLQIGLFSGTVLYPSVNTTNWPSAPKLNYGPDIFYVDYTSNNFPGVTFTTPVDAASSPVRTWTTSVNLSSEAFDSIVVGPNPPQLINPHMTGTNFQFSFLSQTGVTNSVQYRTNLVSGNWLTFSNILGNGTLKTIPIPLSVFNHAPQGFVRILAQ